MDISIFTDKLDVPNDVALRLELDNTYSIWKHIEKYVFEKQKNLSTEWSFPSPRYGWSYRIKDRKRVVVYLLPRKGFFMAAFNFGPKAYDEILKSDVADAIKMALSEANVYAEGRGIRIEVKNKENVHDILKLIDIKMK